MMTTTARALNLILDSSVPDWIQLLPAGPHIQGADGRAWNLSNPADLITAFTARNKPLVVDWEHSSEHRAPQGLDAPAAGWIDALEVRDGAIWGHVEWTPKATAQIQAKEYRFLSPVFTYQKDGARIVALTSAGLTNQPNLNLTALNRAEDAMTIPVSVLTALGVADASEAGVLEAVNRLKSASEKPDLAKFIPRADYDAALARASNAEAKITEIEKTQRNSAVAALIDGALKACKISPATKDFYFAVCQTEAGIEQFKSFLEKAPALVGDGLAKDVPIPTSTPETEFAANAALKAEFGDVDTYKAYRTAMDSGRVSIMGVKA